MKLEVLHVADCPNVAPLLKRIAQVTNVPVTKHLVQSDAQAKRLGMSGSPTLLIDGVDPFAVAGDGQSGMSCRLYQEAGRIVLMPSVEQLRSAIERPQPPGGVLSAWRRRAVPLDDTESAVHQAILRAFAATGHPPEPSGLDHLAADRGTAEVLRALHDLDAIRMTSYGEIAVAYPFSTVPTRHRVRIGDEVDVYAMCAVDALGIAPMLGEDTLIESVDVTTGRPVTVTTQAGRTDWDPAGAVVFVGADAGGGPSADCCCDYLNFFTDREAAEVWSAGHPQVPGQILDQPEAEGLAARLFSHLLGGPQQTTA